MNLTEATLLSLWISAVGVQVFRIPLPQWSLLQSNPEYLTHFKTLSTLGKVSSCSVSSQAGQSRSCLSLHSPRPHPTPQVVWCQAWSASIIREGVPAARAEYLVERLQTRVAVTPCAAAELQPTNSMPAEHMWCAEHCGDQGCTHTC